MGVARPDEELVGVEVKLDGGRLARPVAEVDPVRPVPPRGEAEIEVVVDPVVSLGLTVDRERLDDRVVGGIVGERDAPRPRRIYVGIRTLGRGGHPRPVEVAPGNARPHRNLLRLERTVDPDDRAELGLDRGLAGVDLLDLGDKPGEGLVVCLLPCGGLGGRHHWHKIARTVLLLRAGEGVAGAVENPVESIVVGRRDRVELVVVAAGTAKAETEHRLADRVDRVLDRQVLIILRVEPEPA